MKAEEPIQDFDKEKLEELWGGEGFDQERKNEAVPFYGKEPKRMGSPSNQSGSGNENSRSSSYPSSSRSIGGAASTFMYLIAAIFLCLIIFLVLRNTLGGAGMKIAGEQIPELGEGDIQSLDTRSLIQQALDRNDFRQAIRLQYLDVLKGLDEKKWIHWEQNKTNQDYVRELAKSKHGEAFERLTYHFDYAWYGDFRVGKDLYDKIAPGFREFKKRLGT
ncbi:MAG: DUF4129 domain-containing protein [Bacteroidota bacterium]